MKPDSMDAPIEFAVDLLFAQVGHQAETAGDERDLAGELPRVAAELEAATGPEVTVGVEKPCQDGKTRRTAANPIGIRDELLTGAFAENPKFTQSVDQHVAVTAHADEMVGIGGVVGQLVDAYGEAEFLRMGEQTFGNLGVRRCDRNVIDGRAVTDQDAEEIWIECWRIAWRKVHRQPQQLVRMPEARRSAEPFAHGDVDQFTIVTAPAIAASLIGANQRQNVIPVDHEGVALDRPDLDHLVFTAVQFEHVARGAVGAHQELADCNGFHVPDRSIEHEDRGAGRMAAGRRDAKRVAVGIERSNAALDEQFLTRTEHHGQALTSPRWDGCRRPEPLTAMRGGLQPGSSALAVTRETPLPAVASWPARR